MPIHFSFPMFPDFQWWKNLWMVRVVLCFFTQATISNQTGDMIAKLISLKSDVHAKSWMGATERRTLRNMSTLFVYYSYFEVMKSEFPRKRPGKRPFWFHFARCPFGIQNRNLRYKFLRSIEFCCSSGNAAKCALNMHPNNSQHALNCCCYFRSLRTSLHCLATLRWPLLAWPLACTSLHEPLYGVMIVVVAFKSGWTILIIYIELKCSGLHWLQFSDNESCIADITRIVIVHPDFRSPRWRKWQWKPHNLQISTRKQFEPAE